MMWSLHDANCIQERQPHTAWPPGVSVARADVLLGATMQVQALGSATSTDASPFAQRLAGGGSQRPSIELTHSSGDSAGSAGASGGAAGASGGTASAGYPPPPPAASPYGRGAGDGGGDRQAGNGRGAGGPQGGVSPDVMRALGFKGSSAHH